MAKTLSEKLGEVSEVRRRQVRGRAQELIDEELSLRELRRALDKTQVEIAELLGVGQDAVSRYEARTDMLLSTLESYVQALGGQLTIVAEFPNRKPIRLSGFGDLLDDEETR